MWWACGASKENVIPYIDYEDHIGVKRERRICEPKNGFETPSLSINAIDDRFSSDSLKHPQTQNEPVVLRPTT